MVIAIRNCKVYRVLQIIEGFAYLTSFEDLGNNLECKINIWEDDDLQIMRSLEK